MPLEPEDWSDDFDLLCAFLRDWHGLAVLGAKPRQERLSSTLPLALAAFYDVCRANLDTVITYHRFMHENELDLCESPAVFCAEAEGV